MDGTLFSREGRTIPASPSVGFTRGCLDCESAQRRGCELLRSPMRNSCGPWRRSECWPRAVPVNCVKPAPNLLSGSSLLPRQGSPRPESLQSSEFHPDAAAPCQDLLLLPGHLHCGSSLPSRTHSKCCC